MHLEDIHSFCLAKTAVEETFPFDQSTLAYKVAGKIFALIDIDDPSTINLKCDPERAIALREEYDEIIPGFHMNKKHWNTVALTGSLKRSLIEELISHSYELVVQSLPKKTRSELENR